MKTWVPRPYHPLMTSFMLRVKRCCLFVPMGFGKTSAVLSVIMTMLLVGKVRKILVLAPLRVARTTWPAEVVKWSQFAGIEAEFIENWTHEEARFLRLYRQFRKHKADSDKNGVKPETKVLLAALKVTHADARATRLRIIDRLDVVTVNYDVAEQLTLILGDAWPFDMVVADEATRLKSFRIDQGGVRAKALSKNAFTKTERWVNLTGTPAPNGLQDLWGLMWFIDQGSRLGRSYASFMERFFGYKRTADAYRPDTFRVTRVAFPHAQGEIENLIKDVCLTLKVEDWFDIAQPIVHTIYVDMGLNARKAYREMQKEMFTVLSQMLGDGTRVLHEIEAVAIGAKTIKCLQIANGAAYINGDNKEWVDVHDEKIKALESIVHETNGASLLVAYNFKSDVVRLRKHFPGAVLLDSSTSTIDDWNAGKIPMLLVHPKSAGHGLNLAEGGNILVFFGHWWALEDRMQVIERIGPVRQHQAGLDRPVFIYNIVARKTIDEQVIERIETKRSVQEVLLDALNRFRQEEENVQY